MMVRASGTKLAALVLLGRACCQAAAAATPDQAAPVPVNAGADNAQALPEVIVTATRRAENESKVAGSVTAVTQQQLQALGAQDLSDYLTTVPGVQFDQVIPGYSLISMRGVSTSNTPGQTQTPVGIFYDEVPLTDPGATVMIPDIDPFDMSRVEVLRGPQGALFGSAALGGAINYIPNHAQLGGYDAQAEASGFIGHDSQLGGDAKAMLNVPLLKDRLAVRFVGYWRREPGYIDNIGIGRDHSNDQEAAGGRMMVDWALGPDTTLSASALYQRMHVGDIGYQMQGLGGLQKSTRIAEPNTGRLNLDNLRLESNLGFAKLIGIAGYQYKYFAQTADASTTLASAFGPALGGALGPGAYFEGGTLHGYTAELRLVSPTGPHFEWLAGAYYSNRYDKATAQLDAEGLESNPNLLDPVFGPGSSALVGPDGSLTMASDLAKTTELNLYADASYKFGPHWKLSAGGRGYRDKATGNNDQSGLFVLLGEGVPSTSNQGAESDEGFNPRVSLSYSPNDNALFYALYSRGFSLGGANIAPTTQTGGTVPPSWGPSKLYNYELGAKTAWLDHRLLVDVTPFYTYWQDIPLSLISSGTSFSYEANVGSSHSYGVEGTITAQPVKHLVLTNSFTYMRAVLGNSYDPGNTPGAGIASGTPLPGSPRLQLSSLITYRWRMGALPYHASLVNRYLGGAGSSIQNPSVRQGGYDLISLRGGVALGDFTAELFVNNLTDRRGLGAVSYISSSQVEQYVIQPRTVGVQLSWSMP